MRTFIFLSIAACMLAAAALTTHVSTRQPANLKPGTFVEVRLQDDGLLRGWISESPDDMFTLRQVRDGEIVYTRVAASAVKSIRVLRLPAAPPYRNKPLRVLASLVGSVAGIVLMVFPVGLCDDKAGCGLGLAS